MYVCMYIYIGSTERAELVVDKYDDEKEKKVGVIQLHTYSCMR